MSEKKIPPLHRDRLNLPDKEKLKQEYEARRKSLMLDMAQTFGSPEGMRALEYIMVLSGYGKTNVGANPSLGMDVKDGTLYNAARESIYLELRGLISPKILKKVEFGDLIEIS